MGTWSPPAPVQGSPEGQCSRRSSPRGRSWAQESKWPPLTSAASVPAAETNTERPSGPAQGPTQPPSSRWVNLDPSHRGRLWMWNRPSRPRGSCQPAMHGFAWLAVLAFHTTRLLITESVPIRSRRPSAGAHGIHWSNHIPSHSGAADPSTGGVTQLGGLRGVAMVKGWKSGFLGPAEAFIQRSPCGAVSPTGPRNVGLGRRGALAAIEPDPPNSWSRRLSGDRNHSSCLNRER